jgi:hypothetical protein
MSTTITELTIRTIESNSYDALSTTVGFVAVIVLVVVLVEREMIAAYGSPELRIAARALSAFAVPLALSWALIVILRLVDLLRA